MASRPSACIFCGAAPKRLTKEDVWPTWLAAHIPRSMSSYSDGKRMFAADGQAVETRRKIGGDPCSRRAKCVCADCNNGWMSQLQEHAKPILLALATGSEIVLTPEHQKLLATWIAMSAITSEFFDPSMVAVSEGDRLWLWQNKEVPPGWKIWIGKYQRGDWKPHRVHNALPIGTEAETVTDGVLRPNTQSTTLVVGELYGHAISSPHADIIQRLMFKPPLADLLHLLHPTTDGCVEWPSGRDITDKEADDIAGFFLSRLVREGA